MNNTLVRAFVLCLAVAGFGASSVSSKATTTAKLGSAPKITPTPLCVPSDPSYCGMQ